MSSDNVCFLREIRKISVLFSWKIVPYLELWTAGLHSTGWISGLTLKTPRKAAFENVVCLCYLLNILANFSNLFLHIGKQWTQITLLLEEQSDLGPHCLQK